ncbi:hypothetical protein Mgra_00004333 [Meloidogyne graminicola]|uniref:Uncharacterized protein n=1 Tax=Meloidogyne graminicola TaxID=189291 RepID=A0A8S9ZS92_9BILA|nr:hypothetical protein Mgra_00004333 [Meloidogyne graminicola]
MRFALLITLTIYSTNAMVNVVPSVNPHVFVREENELRQHNNYSPPKAIFNKGTNMVAMKRTNTDRKLSRSMLNLSIKAKASQSDFNKIGSGAIEPQNSPFNRAVDYSQKKNLHNTKANEISNFLTKQHSIRENAFEMSPTSNIENKKETIELENKNVSNIGQADKTMDKEISNNQFKPSKFLPLNENRTKSFDKIFNIGETNRKLVSFEKRTKSSPVESDNEYLKIKSQEIQEFEIEEVTNFLALMNKFISIGGLALKDILDVHSQTMTSQERFKFVHALKLSTTEKMVNIVRNIIFILDSQGIEDKKGVYSQLFTWAIGTFAFNLPYSIKHNNGDLVPFRSNAMEKELKMLLEMTIYYNKEENAKIKETASQIIKYFISKIFPEKEFFDGGYASIFNDPMIKNLNSEQNSIHDGINNYLITIIKFTEENGKMFKNEKQRNDFISFLYYIHSDRLALISKHLFNIFEENDVEEGEKMSKLCYWAINTFALNLINNSTKRERSKIIYLNKFKITREEISELLKSIFESIENNRRKRKN